MATKRDSRPLSVTAPGISRVQTQPFASKPDSTPPGAPEEAGSQREFDPFRFAVTELPTGMRQELIATKLPVVPAEQLFDTRPPNARLTPQSLGGRPSAPDSLPAVDSDQNLALPVRSNQVLIVGGMALLFFAVALFFALGSSSGTAAAPPEQRMGEHVPPQAAVQPRAAPAQNVDGTDGEAARKDAPAAKPSSLATALETETQSRPSQPVTPSPAPSPREAAQARPKLAVPAPNVPAAPAKKSALSSVLAPPPD